MTVDLRAAVRAFVQREIDDGSFVPDVNAWMDGHNPGFSRKLGSLGWIGMSWPARFGGGERSGLERFVVAEELLVAGAPVAAHWFADRQVGPQLLRFGTEEQQARFLPRIIRGEYFFAVGMSESQAGSDLAAVRTSAVRCDGGWRLSGRKVWTSHADVSHYMVALCRTSSVEGSRHAGLTQFIVDLHAAGVSVEPIRGLDGRAHFAEVFMEDVFVSDQDVIGEIGRGWEQVTAELAYERSGPERFLSVMPLVREAIPIAAGHETLIGELVAELIALRQLSSDVAAALDRGETPDVQAALVKDVGTCFEQATVDRLRVLQGRSARFDDLLRQAQLSAPAFTLRGGTTEVLRGIIGKMVAG